MKIKMKLEQVIDNKQEKNESFTFLFKPTLDDWNKRVILKVSCTDPYETMGKLVLPQGIGDLIVMELIKKEEQDKLKVESKKKED